MRGILIDLSKTFPMKPSELKISISVENYIEKTAENYRNCYILKKSIISKQSKILIQNFDNRNGRLQ